MPSYITLSELYVLGLPASALPSSISTDARQAQCDAASATAQSYMAARYPMPLVSVGDEVKEKVAWIAAYNLLVIRGFNPSGADANYLARFDRAIDWLKDVSRGWVQPDVVPAPATTPDYDAPRIITTTTRGW